jgi:hypothetical protein
MQFGYKTTAYLESLQSVFVKSVYEITGFNWRLGHVCINKVDYWKKRNGKVVKVFHKFSTWYKIPEQLIKYREVEKTGISTSWIWADDPYYTRTVKEKFITRGSARWIVDNRNSIEKVKH